jgi:hypothetical protein
VVAALDLADLSHKDTATGKYSDYFKHQSWYRTDCKDHSLTPMESRNANFLHVTELTQDLNGQRKRYGEIAAPLDSANPLVKESSTRELTAKDLEGLSSDQLLNAEGDIPNAIIQTRNLSWLEQRNVEFIALTEWERELGLSAGKDSSQK